MEAEALRAQFLTPPGEFGPMPFWFWNAEITEAGIETQLHDFLDKGVTGFVLHPRIGMPEDIPYLSERFMELVAHALDFAATHDMRVLLYDEAMYPSGSAHGRVVAADPAHASKGLRMREIPVQTAAGALVDTVREDGIIPLPLMPGEQLVAAMAIRHDGNGRTMDVKATCLLEESHGTVTFFPPDGEQWSILAFVLAPSGGTIRGLHFGEDDGDPGAPPSADLLNPAAVQSFLRQTHDVYAARLQHWFGTPVIGFFTDEPSILGRNAAPDLVPWTDDFLTDWQAAGLEETDLPYLWWEANGAPTVRTGILDRYHKAVAARLARTYYAGLSEWCVRHDLLLAGHPESSMDIGMLSHFGMPGQDLVWRWVGPEEGKALSGPHSTMAKSAADAARHAGRRRNANECFGCCGPEGIQWAFSVDDMKWMLDWLFVRGVNQIIPHAFYYSVEGSGRYGERPPDVGPNNIWWPSYRDISLYIRRMSWLMTDSAPVTRVAVLCTADWVPWRVVAPLYRRQIGFDYVEESWLQDAMDVVNTTDTMDATDATDVVDEEMSAEGITHVRMLRVGTRTYDVLLVEDPHRMRADTRNWLRNFAAAGGQVWTWGGGDMVEAPHATCADDPEPATIISKRQEPEWFGDMVAYLDTRQASSNDGPVIPQFDPPCPNLRLTTVRKAGELFHLLVNEGEQAVETVWHRRDLAADGRKLTQWWPWTGRICPLPMTHVDHAVVGLPLRLERRESLMLHVSRPHACRMVSDGMMEQPHGVLRKEEPVLQLAEGWRLSGGDMAAPLALDALRPWEEMPDTGGGSRELVYTCSFRFEPEAACRYVLDFGSIGEIAWPTLNGMACGVLLWAPWRVDVTEWLRNGNNVLSLRVRNSLAHRYAHDACLEWGAKLPRLSSGLLGPVRLLKITSCHM